MMADKLKGEMMDLQHGLTFLKNVKITADTGRRAYSPNKN